MRICTTCKKEKKWRDFAGMGSCRECNKKICSICGKEFCPTGKKSHCSDRCNLLGNIKKSENGCWEWQKYKTKHGYGVIKRKPKNILSHRLSYEIFLGKFDNSLFVCHKCDNPSCINPDHLFLGTHIDNCNDCINKKRQFPINTVRHLRKGKVCRGAKLSPKEVQEIRQLKKDGIKRKVIAEKFNITSEHVWGITSLKAWSHI